MYDRERTYRWYLTGCDRLAQPALSEDEFNSRWQEFEAHAELLKAADDAGEAPAVEPARRAEMARRVSEDPFVKAILVGMSQDPDAIA